MANAAEHRKMPAFIVTSARLLLSGEDATRIEELLATYGLAWLMGTLPNILESATNPNHRQFFHSIVFACGLGYGMFRLYEWQPEEEWHEWARQGLLIAGAATLIHLVMDSTTPKGLPLV